MNDQELIALIDNTLPEDLTSEQIEMLRQRIKGHPELAQRLLFELRFEQSLATELAPTPQSFNTILERLGNEVTDPRARASSKLGATLLLGLVILLIGGGIAAAVISGMGSKDDPDNPEINPPSPTITEGEDNQEPSVIARIEDDPDTPGNPDTPSNNNDDAVENTDDNTTPVHTMHPNFDRQLLAQKPIEPQWTVFTNPHQGLTHQERGMRLRELLIPEKIVSRKGSFKDRGSSYDLEGEFKLNHSIEDNWALRMSFSRLSELKLYIGFFSDTKLPAINFTDFKTKYDLPPGTDMISMLGMQEREPIHRFKNNEIIVQCINGQIILRYGNQVITRPYKKDMVDPRVHLVIRGTPRYIDVQKLPEPDMTEAPVPQITREVFEADTLKWHPVPDLLDGDALGFTVDTLLHKENRPTHTGHILELDQQLGETIELDFEDVQPGAVIVISPQTKNFPVDQKLFETLKREPRSQSFEMRVFEYKGRVYYTHGNHHDARKHSIENNRVIDNGFKVRIQYTYDRRIIFVNGIPAHYDELNAPGPYIGITDHARELRESDKPLWVLKRITRYQTDPLARFTKFIQPEQLIQVQQMLDSDKAEDYIKNDTGSPLELLAKYYVLIQRSTNAYQRRQDVLRLAANALLLEPHLDASYYDHLQWLPNLILIDQSTTDFRRYLSIYNQAAHFAPETENEQEALEALWHAYTRFQSNNPNPDNNTKDGVLPTRLATLLFFSYLRNNQWNQLREFSLHAIFIMKDAVDRMEGNEAEIKLVRLMNWGIAMADAQLGDRPIEKQYTVQDSWRHPLDIRVSRMALNGYAEFQAALTNKAYETATRILVDGQWPRSLAPVQDDPTLYQSIQDSLKLAVDENPRIQEILKQAYADLAELRYRKAIAQSNEKALRAVAIQFQSTPAAIDAIRYLADLDLSRGNFRAAEAQYKRIATLAPESYTLTDRAKARIASATLGQDNDDPIKQDVTFNGQRFKADQFERMIKSIIARRKSGAGIFYNQANMPAPKASHKIQFQQDWITLGVGGRMDNRDMLRFTTLVSNEHYRVFQMPGRIVVLPPDSNKPIWDDSFKSRDTRKSLAKVTPLLTDKTIYTRLHHNNRYQLASLDIPSKKVTWKSIVDHDWVSDPVAVGDWIYALSARHGVGLNYEIFLRQIAPDSGDTLALTPMITLQWPRNTTLPVSTLIDGDQLIFAMPGTVIVTTLEGELKWVRRMPFLPHSVAPDLHTLNGPTVYTHDDRILVHTPGSTKILMLSRNNGKIIWSREITEIHQLFEYRAGDVVYSTDDAIYMLDHRSGDTLKALKNDDRYSQSIRTKDGLLTYTVLPNKDKNAPGIAELAWRTTSITQDPILKIIQNKNRISPPLRLITDGKAIYVITDFDTRHGRIQLDRITPSRP